MSSRQDFSDIGDRIKDAVQNAVETGDFGHINEMVTETVNSAMDEVRHQVNQVHEKISRPLQGQGSAFSGSAGRSARSSADREHQPLRTFRSSNGSGSTSLRPSETFRPSPYYREKGKVAGALCTALGTAGLGIFGFTTLSFWLAGFLEAQAWGGARAFGMVTLGFVALLLRGRSLQNRVQRARRYFALTREKMYMGIADMAARTDQSIRRLRRDMRKMLRAGIFPEGHMDGKQSVFVLNDETWNQYLITQKNWEEKKRLGEDGTQTAQPAQPKEEILTEEQQIEKDGHVYMDRLRELNVQIPGEVISNKLYQLDFLLQRIFSALKEHPEKCPQMRKFMDYYLPMTVKLVESYADFDRAGVQSGNVQSAKEEIERTLGSINQAFEKLLDELYQDAAFEAAADAKVLKTILAQDGYGEKDFEKTGEK